MTVPDDPLALLDPVVTLQVGDGGSSTGRDRSVLGDKGKLSSVTGLCLVGPRSIAPLNRTRLRIRESDDTGESSDEDDEDDSEPLHFQCRTVLGNELGPSSSVDFLRGRHVVSCHANGDSFVWDLERRRVQAPLCANRGGPGLAIRRMASNLWGDEHDENEVCVIYQTRDEAGTLSLHHFKPDGTICQLQTVLTQSQSFCAASPCANHPHLVATPDGDETAAIVRDFRMDPSSHPAAVICTSKLLPPPATSSSSSAPPSVDRKYGMLTSLAFAVASSSLMTQEATHASPADEASPFNVGSGWGRPLVACGMESGHVLLYDLAAASSRAQPVIVVDGPPPNESVPSHPVWLDDPSASVSLGADPVLALDMAPSEASGSREASLSMVIAAGLAGTLEDLAALDAAEQGRVALLKCRRNVDDAVAWTCRIRSRYATCRIPSDRAGSQDWIGMGGKPGVSQCRFRHGRGRLLAVAGWDRRVRIFDRAASKSSAPNEHGRTGSALPQSAALAVLRGHATTVTAIDWASDAETSGLLASAGNDGRIHVWRLNF